MDCNRIQDRLVDYLTEETRPTERLCVDVHLATCYHCREALEDVRMVLDAAKDTMRYAGPERTFESTMNEIRTREALLAFSHAGEEEESERWSWGFIAAALPIVVACITPFVVAWPGGARSVNPDQPPLVGADAAQVSETVRADAIQSDRAANLEFLLATP
jgi:anti-sigma factor RsiW